MKFRPALLRATLIAAGALSGLLMGGAAGAIIGTAAVMVALCFVPQDRIRPTNPALRLRDEPKLWGG